MNVDLDKLNLLVEGVQVYTQGMAAYHEENINDLKAALEELNTMKSKAEKQMVVGAPKMCSGVSRYLQPPSVNEVNSIKVLEFELKSFLAILNKDEKSVENWLREATVIEETTSYTYGPPNIVKPSFELYGEWLLEHNRKEEAKQQFEKVLLRAPKRRLAVMGIEKVTG
jgi:hypothetical protein